MAEVTQAKELSAGGTLCGSYFLNVLSSPEAGIPFFQVMKCRLREAGLVKITALGSNGDRKPKVSQWQALSKQT